MQSFDRHHSVIIGTGIGVFDKEIQELVNSFEYDVEIEGLFIEDDFVFFCEKPKMLDINGPFDTTGKRFAKNFILPIDNNPEKYSIQYFLDELSFKFTVNTNLSKKGPPEEFKSVSEANEKLEKLLKEKFKKPDIIGKCILNYHH